MFKIDMWCVCWGGEGVCVCVCVCVCVSGVNVCRWRCPCFSVCFETQFYFFYCYM
jgi:hypothetical protein